MQSENKKAGEAAEGDAVVEDKKPEKKKAQRITLKPDHLLKPTGIEALYKTAKTTKFTSPDEIKNLGKVVDLLKAWHFELMPKYNFEYFVERCQAFGSTKLIQVWWYLLMQSYMAKVRKIHKGEDTWDENAPAAANEP